MDFFVRLEQTAFFTWVREAGSLWGYPAILFLHTLGLGTVAGLNAGIGLRILGCAPNVPLPSLARFYRLIWIAFAVTVVSGTILLLADASTKLPNPALWVKLVLVAAALVVMQAIRARALTPQADGQDIAAGTRALAIVSLVLWIGATIAGRLMAYVGPVSGLE